MINRLGVYLKWLALLPVFVVVVLLGWTVRGEAFHERARQPAEPIFWDNIRSSLERFTRALEPSKFELSWAKAGAVWVINPVQSTAAANNPLEKI